MIPVILAPLGKCACIGILGARPEQASLLPVAGHAFAAEIIEMGSERC